MESQIAPLKRNSPRPSYDQRFEATRLLQPFRAVLWPQQHASTPFQSKVVGNLRTCPPLGNRTYSGRGFVVTIASKIFPTSAASAWDDEFLVVSGLVLSSGGRQDAQIAIAATVTSRRTKEPELSVFIVRQIPIQLTGGPVVLAAEERIIPRQGAKKNN